MKLLYVYFKNSHSYREQVKGAVLSLLFNFILEMPVNLKFKKYVYQGMVKSFVDYMILFFKNEFQISEIRPKGIIYKILLNTIYS